jgi:hypothetical protein
MLIQWRKYDEKCWVHHGIVFRLYVGLGRRVAEKFVMLLMPGLGGDVA